MKNTTKKLTMTALFAAIICVATMIIRIPIAPTNGYIHLGDAFVILAGLLLGSVYGAAAAGTGAMLADVIGGYFVYAPATFIIKALMALSVWLIYDKAGVSKQKKEHENVKCFIGGVIAAIINVAGYFSFEWVLYGTAALLGISGNLIQGLSGLVISVILYPFLRRAYQRI